MQDLLENSNAIKLRLMQQFYGIEEFLDLEEPLPTMLEALDTAQSEFNLADLLCDLDLWYIKVSNSDDAFIWDPFVEPLCNYSKRYELIIAHLYPEKQWSNAQILAYVRQSESH